MPAELFALAAAFGFAAGKITVKFATQSGPMIQGYLVSLATGTLTLGVVAALTVATWAIPLWAVAFFALAGVAGPGAARILSIRAVRDAGTSVAAPLQSSTNPLLASLAGVILFNETVGLGRVVALAMVVAGIWACARGGSANRPEQAPLAAGGNDNPGRYLVLLWPLAAGAAYALSDVVKKVGLGEHPDPVLGSFIGLATAFTIWLVIYLTAPQFRERQPLRVTRSLGWFCLSGLLSAVAATSLMFALRTGDLSVVAPIVASQPVIVIVLGALVLRDVEKLRPGTVVGAAVVFLGVAYLSVT